MNAHEQAEIDYSVAKELGLISLDRWDKGIKHHPMSERLAQFIELHDFNDYNDYFCWSIGGDGDNGETLMYEMDAFFEMLDGVNRNQNNAL